MNIRISRGDQKMAQQVDTHSLLFNDSYLNVEHYRIAKRGGISVNNHDDHDKYPPEYIYFILEGRVQFVIAEEKFELQPMDAIRIQGYGHILIFGLEESSVLFFTASECADTDPYAELTTLVKQTEAKDVYTQGHNERVGRIAGKLASSLLPGALVDKVITAGAYHDVGKIRIPDEILNKPGKLTDEEYAVIKQHPIYSYEILGGFLDDDICRIARGHHEMLDGSGYPDHLSGDDIPYGSKILAVADIFDALTSSRVYRVGYRVNEALDIMYGMKGRLDMTILDKLVQLIEKNVVEPDENGDYR